MTLDKNTPPETPANAATDGLAIQGCPASIEVKSVRDGVVEDTTVKGSNSVTRRLDVVAYQRETDDWYVEQAWAVERLAEAEQFVGKVWDPACGMGTIPEVFKALGFETIATDLRNRGYGAAGQDFLKYDRRKIRPTDNIVANPPFKHIIPFLKQARAFTTRRVAFLVPLKWLASDTRFQLFSTYWKPARVYVLSDRLSMPPGHFLDPETRLFNCDDPSPKRKPDGTPKYRWRNGDKPGGGAVDFCWVVWDHDHEGATETRWLSRSGVLV